MKYVIFQYKGIKFSFNENFRFLMLKWDDHQFKITVMRFYNWSWLKMLIFKVDQFNSLSEYVALI